MLLLRHCTLLQNANRPKTSSTGYQQSSRKAELLKKINKVLTGKGARGREGLLPGNVKESQSVFLGAR